MAEKVGLSRNFKLEWLDLVADCQLAHLTKEEAQERLDEMIRQTINAKDNVRKTRTIILNLWYNTDDWYQSSCIAACQRIMKLERLPLHWALLMIRYPVFFDLCVVIGTMLDYREDVSLGHIRERIYEKWGARATLTHSLSKNIQSLRDIGVLEATKSPGIYRATKTIVTDRIIASILVVAVIECSGCNYLNWGEIIHHPALFPFQIEHVSQADVAACDRLTLEKMGDDVVLRIK
jgi:hypothetical protein